MIDIYRSHSLQGGGMEEEKETDRKEFYHNGTKKEGETKGGMEEEK